MRSQRVIKKMTGKNGKLHDIAKKLWVKIGLTPVSDGIYVMKGRFFQFSRMMVRFKVESYSKKIEGRGYNHVR